MLILFKILYRLRKYQPFWYEVPLSLKKNGLKDGKSAILCSDFGNVWKSGPLQAVAHQNLGK